MVQSETKRARVLCWVVCRLLWQEWILFADLLWTAFLLAPVDEGS